MEDLLKWDCEFVILPIRINCLKTAIWTRNVDALFTPVRQLQSQSTWINSSGLNFLFFTVLASPILLVKRTWLWGQCPRIITEHWLWTVLSFHYAHVLQLPKWKQLTVYNNITHTKHETRSAMPPSLHTITFHHQASDMNTLTIHNSVINRSNNTVNYITTPMFTWNLVDVLQR